MIDSVSIKCVISRENVLNISIWNLTLWNTESMLIFHSPRFSEICSFSVRRKSGNVLKLRGYLAIAKEKQIVIESSNKFATWLMGNTIVQRCYWDSTRNIIKKLMGEIFKTSYFKGTMRFLCFMGSCCSLLNTFL